MGLSGGLASNGGAQPVTAGSDGSVYITNRWYPPAGNTSTLLSVVNTGYANIFPMNGTHTFQAIGVNVTTGGGSGSVTRFGVYADNGAGYPGALVLDYGTVASTASSAVASIATSLTLTPGLYWLVAVSQVGTAPTWTCMGGTAPVYAPILGASTAAASFVGGGWVLTSFATGSLPNPFTAGASISGETAVPLVRLEA